jgi:hypothetical protein
MLNEQVEQSGILRQYSAICLSFLGKFYRLYLTVFEGKSFKKSRGLSMNNAEIGFRLNVKCGFSWASKKPFMDGH